MDIIDLYLYLDIYSSGMEMEIVLCFTESLCVLLECVILMDVFQFSMSVYIILYMIIFHEQCLCRVAIRHYLSHAFL